MLIKRSAVKQLALATAGTHRPAAGFTRVSAEFFEAVETATRNFVTERVKRTPSIGKTLK